MRRNQKNERRGMILLVVLALLTLFAIVGISFVLYADAEATSARLAREAEKAQRSDADPRQALAYFLSQFLYDADDVTGTGSGLRGHSLSRSMYGYNSTYNFPFNTNLNINPFNGVGRLHTNGSTWPYMNPFSIDDHLLVNYTWFQGDNFVRAPEWYTSGQQNNPNPATWAAGTGYYVGCNAPYTYPDLNNFFLAAVRSDGTLLTPSYHRPWLFQNVGGKFYAFNDLSNPNWNNAQGKYLTLRPRPNEHPLFPYPDDATGDVKNLVGWPGGNDSIWIDIGAPIMYAPDGTPYKMLFAPLVMDLDNRINVNAAGNVVGTITNNGTTTNNISLSNQGWIPSEVNLGSLWSGSALSTEWWNLFLGAKANGMSYFGKYGPDNPPIATAPLYPVGSAAHVYAQKDSDGRDETKTASSGGQWCPPTAPIQLPGAGANANPQTCFPYFPTGYGGESTGERIVGGTLTGTGAVNPILYRHPAAYAVYKPNLFTNTTYNTDYNPPVPLTQLLNPPVIPASNNDLVFPVSDMDALLRAGTTGQPVDSGSSALISSMQRLCPKTLGGTNLQPRSWITSISSDLLRPALSPWVYDPTSAPPTVTSATFSLPPFNATATNFRSFADRAKPLPAGSDFTTDWRALNAVLGRLDLNRSLPPYPHMGTGIIPMMTNSPVDRFDMDSTAYKAANIETQFFTATSARQQLALDIYTYLLALTGVPLPSNLATPTPADLAPRRWLAQLAVNIVDYIDGDEISTPFNYYNPKNSPTGLPISVTVYNNFEVTPTGTNTIPNHPAPNGTGGNPDMPMYWVFGTEMPRVVINEVMGEYTLPTAPSTTFNVKVWAELSNPMPPSASVQTTQTTNVSTLQPMDSWPVPLYVLSPTGGTSANQGAYNPYQLLLADNNTTAANANGLWYDNLGLNNNVLGTPRYNYYVNPKALTPVTAGCNFGAGISETNAGSAGTASAPGTINYPLYYSSSNKGSWGLSGGLPWNPANPPSMIIVGPADPPPGTTINDVKGDIPAAGAPASTPWVGSPNMQYQVTLTGGQWTVTLPGNLTPIPITDNTSGISVLLRRLANPHLPPNPFTANGSLSNTSYPPNPYITVDYVSGATLNAPASSGKLQPFAGNLSQYASQTAPHTLGSVNSTLANPFTWLVHLDRNLISPMELLHVSGFHPHELTQRFIIGPTAGTGYPPISQPFNYTPPAGSNVPAIPNGYFQHYVPWFDQTNRLYRFFEFLEAYNGASGVCSVNGRVPGKININTLWDQPSVSPQMAQAICDPPPPPFSTPNDPNFTLANVQSIFQTLLTYRTKNLGANSPTLSAADVPFVGMAAGAVPAGDSQYAAGLGINNTFFTSGVATTLPTTANALGQGAQLQLPTNSPTAAGLSTTHPYLQSELMTKIYSRLTTRSNVFAVFLTVGFFQVVGNVPGSPNIPQLGPELGRSEGRQTRHRMFAIVDRTQLTAFSSLCPTAVPAPSQTPPQTWTPNLNPQTIVINPNNQTGLQYQTVTGKPWMIWPGAQVVLEPGTVNEETVIVTSVLDGNDLPIPLGTDPSNITPPIQVKANFLLQHPNQLVEGNPNVPPFVIIQRGNPGPWVGTGYDPRYDPLLVPYFTIIE